MTKSITLPVPMSSPDISSEERAAVNAVMGTTSLSMGSQIGQFEKSFQDLLGVKHAIGVNSGTAGLHLCVRASGIEAGDLVITTPFSFVASTNVILFEQAIPIFVDIDPHSGNIRPDLVHQAVEDILAGGAAACKWMPRKGAETQRKLKAILPVDVFGQPADMDAINATAKQHHLTVIEDSCEALGAEYKGRQAGTLGDFGVYGFYPNKQVTTGEGGMIVTQNDQAAAFMQALRNQGRAPGDNWLQHTFLGYNYRLDEMSAALGLAQMKRFETLLQTRQQVADWYQARLKDIPQVEAPFVEPHTTRSSWFVYVIKLQPGTDRLKVVRLLAEKSIPVRPYFLPIHLQPYMMEMFGYQPGDFPVTEDLGERGLALPFSGVMSEEQVDYVCQELKQVIQRL